MNLPRNGNRIKLLPLLNDKLNIYSSMAISILYEVLVYNVLEQQYQNPFIFELKFNII